jgi:hypothetical protein
MSKRINDILSKPSLLFLSLGHRGLLNWMSDETYLKIAFRATIGKYLDLSNPKTFNAKLQWLKIHDRKEEYSLWVDKFEAKRMAADVIGEEHIIPTLGIWDSFDEIDFNQLPDQFVLKCTHDSGGLVICKNKATFDTVKARKKICKSLNHNFFYDGREWPYKNVKPRIIAEVFMSNLGEDDLVDYKLMTFNGKVKCIFTCTKRYTECGTHVTFFDTQWNKLDFGRHYPIDTDEISKPKSLEQMITMAEKIAVNIPFARIDFYDIEGNPYFGEVTFFPGDGFEEFNPEEWDSIMGGWLELPGIAKG